MIRTYIVVYLMLLFSVVSSGEKIKVIATLFPNYDFARNIGGQRAEVRLLLPPGIEAHSYEPTPRDIVDISISDILLYTGKDMEPWVHRLSMNLSKNIKICDVGKDIGRIHGDPHIWTDPLLAIKMVKNITESFIEADPEGRDYYSKRSVIYIKRIYTLHNKIEKELSQVQNRSVIFSGHMVFGYFSRRYNLEFITPYRSFSPDADPTPKRIGELILEMKKRRDKYVYFEELVDPKIAKLISRETGAELLLLHGVHNLSKDEVDREVGYIDIMEDNLANLKRGLK